MTTRKPLTKTQQIENCLLALANWSEVSPHSVNLRVWRCGTHACFGGHLATWPEFRAKGVRTNPEGSPFMGAGTGFMWSVDVAQHLFGNSALFNARGLHADGGLRLSDHRVVVRRLENQIAALSA